MFFKKSLPIILLLCFSASLSWGALMEEKTVKGFQEEIIKVNNLNKRGDIKPGQELKIEFGGVHLGYYTVDAGESVYVIARKILKQINEKRIEEKRAGTVPPAASEAGVESGDVAAGDQAGTNENVEERETFSSLFNQGFYKEAFLNLLLSLSGLQIALIVLAISLLLHWISFLKIRKQKKIILFYEAQAK